MEYITTTELRTKSSELIESLRKGTIVSLIHRSKIVGVIKPQQETTKPFNAKEFAKFVKDLHLPKTTDEEREQNYRNHLMKKYGKNIS
jgi:antitoxin (DNA-binding transcriptional repressor) of toxin-antitoxin stability system